MAAVITVSIKVSALDLNLGYYYNNYCCDYSDCSLLHLCGAA